MAGFGRQPFGRSSAGWGTPSLADNPGGILLRNMQTGLSLGARKIDPQTKDYAMDPDYAGRILGMSPVQQVVQLAVSTEYGSSAVREMGQKLRLIDRVTPNMQQRCFTTLSDALRSAVDQGLVEVLGFNTFKAGPRDGLQPGQTYGRLRYKDLTTGQEHEAVI